MTESRNNQEFQEVNGFIQDKKRQVCLVGIGTGSGKTLSAEAWEAIRESDCIIGAKRMLEAAGVGREDITRGRIRRDGDEKQDAKAVYCEYHPEKIKEMIAAHPEYRKAAVLYSGDIGFYSGAEKLYGLLKDDYEIRGIPGLSCVVYFAAKLHVSWEDARLISIHGRRQPYIHILARHQKTFLLLGGIGQAEEFCRELKEYGLTGLKLWIGRDLSYPEESIICRTGRDIRPEDISGLSVVYAENPSPLPVFCGQIRDEEFIRGNVPMTKEEIRAVSMAKLGLSGESVLYDIGAGTGSIAVTAAASYEKARVYAIEKKAEGIELIRQNQRRFCVDQLFVTEGTAPEILEKLEPPTHVFIGGSSGNLQEILHCIREKNRNAKVVLNVITLETLKEVLSAEEKGLLTDVEIIQAGIARSKKRGNYHMMTGQNPVYIVSARFFV